MTREELVEELNKIDERFNNWNVIYLIKLKNITRQRFCIVRCDCGRLFKRNYYQIKYGHSTKCKECMYKNRKCGTHNKSKTRIYRIWQAMKRRCYTPNNTNYKNYGERGITVCDEWKNSFTAFYDWAMSNGYKDNLSIDRIDNNSGYSPNNCRWTNMHIQSANKRMSKKNKFGYVGVKYDKRYKKYQARITIFYKDYFLGNYNTAEEAHNARKRFIQENNLKEYNIQ